MGGDVVIEAPTADKEYFENLQRTNPGVEIVEIDRFEGLPEVIQVVVPVTASLVPVLVAYFKDKTARAKARILVKDGRKLRLPGYSAREVAAILKSAE